MIELRRSNFRETVERETIVLIECWSPGCNVCKSFDPVFERTSLKYPSHTFARMNIATEEQLGEYFEISHTPSVMLYRDGLLLLKKPGNFSESALDDIVHQAESLDMEKIRADLA